MKFFHNVRKEWMYLVMMIPGLDLDIANIFADGAAVALIAGAAIFAVVAIPTALLLVGREKTL